MPAEMSEVTARAVAYTSVLGLGRVVNTFAIVGPSATNEKNFTVTGLQLTVDEPALVLVQGRQSDNQALGYPDVFGFQVVETGKDHLTLHVKRLDNPGGWSQDLRVDVLIIEQMHS